MVELDGFLCTVSHTRLPLSSHVTVWTDDDDKPSRKSPLKGLSMTFDKLKVAAAFHSVEPLMSDSSYS